VGETHKPGEAAVTDTEPELDVEENAMSSFNHESVVITTGSRSGLPVIVAVHSTALGQAAGGCRLWEYSTWQDALDDALRLSEAMTLKSALAELPLGGGKSVIALPLGYTLGPEQRRAVMLDLGDLVETFGGRFGVAEDVGTTAEDMLVVSERTRFAYCLPTASGGSGDPSEATALGVFAAIRATCERIFGDPSPAKRHFTVVGLGQVGSRLARLLAADGAVLTITDTNASKDSLAGELGARWVPADEALYEATDILVPAALGGLLTPAVVSTLECSAVVGPANNQLASDDVADLLADRGIVWAPDFVVNAGGVIFGALVDVAGLDPSEVLPRIEAIGATIGRIFAIADGSGTTPYAAALQLARDRVAAARAVRADDQDRFASQARS
jgi:leucine dehydrogenase